MFNRRSKRPTHQTDAEQELDLQSAAGEITDAFEDRDMKHLASLSPEQRAIQTKARWKLYEHIDQIWEAPKQGPNGRHPVDIGGYESVAALRDLAMTLWTNAQEAQDAAGDDVDGVTVDITYRRLDD
jgi:hypothetical protein